MTSVRAKFRFCGVKTEVGQRRKPSDGQWEEGKIYTLEFRAVAQSDKEAPENKLFWDASPFGTIMMGCVNEEAAKQFTIGKYYYVDFSEAPA